MENNIYSYVSNKSFNGKTNIENSNKLKEKLIKKGIIKDTEPLYLITEKEAAKFKTKIINKENGIKIYIPKENSSNEKQEYNSEFYYPIQDTNKFKQLLKQKNNKKTSKINLNKNLDEYEETESNVLLKIPNGVALQNPELTQEEYTNNIFKMLKTLNNIPEEDLKLAEKNKKYIKKVLKAFENIDNENEKEMKKAFFNQIKLTENMPEWKIIGHLYNKSKEPNFEGFKKIHTELTIIERNENIESIEQNKHPLQYYNKKTVPYIIDALTNSIYRGLTQMQLQRNNLTNNLSDLSYMPIAGALEAGGKLRPNFEEKAVLVAHGINNNGNHVYSLLLPSRDFIKKEKATRKLAAKHAIMDAKFYAKYGELPLVSLDLTEQKRKPILNSENITVNQINTQKADIKEIINNSLELLFKSMLTQQPEKLPVDFTKEPWKNELKKFANEHPEEFNKLQNEAYIKIAQQTKTETHTLENNNTNEQTQTNSNKNIKSKGRKI